MVLKTMQYIVIFLIVVWTVILEFAALYRMNQSFFFLRFFGGYLYLFLKIGFACSAGAVLWYGFSYQNQYIVPVIAPLISLGIIEGYLGKIEQASAGCSWSSFLEEFRDDLAERVMKMEADQRVDKQLKLAEKLSNVLEADCLEREFHILFLPGIRSIEEANKELEEYTKGMSNDPSTKKRELAQLLVDKNPKSAKTLLKSVLKEKRLNNRSKR
jgi:hypothetical protein